MSTNRSYTLLWNDSSGWDEKEEIRKTVEAVLSSGGPLDVRRVERGSDLLAESRSIAASGTDVLVAAGGDGTINAAASALIHQRTALGVIPAGTLNHFARDLHIPLEPHDAAESLLTGEVIEVDAASVNGHVFINNSVLGLFPNYRSTREAWERRGFGKTAMGRWIAMMAGMLRVFWRLPHLNVEIEAGGRIHKLKTPFVLVGNNEHQMEGFRLGARTSLSEGNLWVYVMRPCSRWSLISIVVGLLLGRKPRSSVFQVFQTPHVRITSKPKRVGVGVDGEMVRMLSPLEFRCLPRALRVIAPAAIGEGAAHE